MYQVLALDLDGTVLNSENKISVPLRETIEVLKDRFHVVLVTGRHHTAAKPYHYELNLNTPIICCNGTYVYDYAAEKVVTQNAIPTTKAHEFLALAEAYKVKLVMYVKDAMLYSKSQPIHYMKALESWSKSFSDASLRPDIRQIDSFADEIDQTDFVWKFVVEGNDLDKFCSKNLVTQHFSGERSWSDRIDFTMKGNTKGNALASYVQDLGLVAVQVVAVGDNHNDISMLEYAGLGVAMENAVDEVKQYSQITTRAGHDDETALADLLNSIFVPEAKNAPPQFESPG